MNSSSVTSPDIQIKVTFELREPLKYKSQESSVLTRTVIHDTHYQPKLTIGLRKPLEYKSQERFVSTRTGIHNTHYQLKLTIELREHISTKWCFIKNGYPKWCLKMTMLMVCHSHDRLSLCKKAVLQYRVFQTYAPLMNRISVFRNY